MSEHKILFQHWHVKYLAISTNKPYY